jgi:hypothetical protein
MPTESLLVVSKPVNPQYSLKELETVSHKFLKFPALFDKGFPLTMSIFGQ